MPDDCVFCKIIAREIPSKIEHQDELCTVFHDISPRASIHLLVIPNRHIPTIKDLQDEDGETMGHIMLVARDIARKFELEDYRLLISVGKKAGQEVFHVHLHLMSAS